VTGSIQTMLVPYWADKLGKGVLRMAQLSRRGGHMTVEPRGNRVLLKGQAVRTVTGSIPAPKVAIVPAVAP
jgi:predicted PhzF superfamily epimerase YddE/YHI9